MNDERPWIFQSNPVDELFNSVLHCSLFGDERDGLIARWNMLQVYAIHYTAIHVNVNSGLF